MSNKIFLILTLLILAAFIGGSRWANLELSKKSQPEELAQGANEAQVEVQEGQEAPQVLGVSDQNMITEGAMAAKGNQGAKVTIVEFSEYQCPYCARYTAEAYQQIWETYGEDIYYVWRDFPLEFHQNAQPAAVAAYCAGRQDQYWQMHDQIFANQEAWVSLPDPKTEFTVYAQNLGLNEEEFSSCMETDQEVFDHIASNFELGKQMGVSGTPTFFINGQKLVGAQPFEAFKTVIDQELSQ